MAAAPVKRRTQARGQGGDQRVIIIATCVAGVAAAGAWLRWAIVPVRIAYGLGRLSERQCARIRAGAVSHRAGEPRTATDGQDEHDL